MTATISSVRDLNGRRRADIPEWLVVEEMDRAKKLAEDATRVHDVLAAEMGYERVRIEAVQPGDVLVRQSLREVTERHTEVEDGGYDHWVVSFTDGGSLTFFPLEFVSRQLPVTDPESEPF
jgi:hypothetical protein